MRKTKRFSADLLLKLYFFVALLYLVFPILVIIPISFSNNVLMRFPPENLGINWYISYFTDDVWLAATFLSLKVALIASLLATVLGTMAVIALERHVAKFKPAISLVVTSPIIVPHIFIALGVFILAIKLGLEDNAMTLAGAHATIAIPFVILIVGAAFRQLDQTYERAARVLGAGPIRAFFSASFPILLPAILAAAVFSFFVSFDELIIAQFLMSGQDTLPMRIWADLRLNLNPTISAVASVLIVATTLGMGAAEILRRKGANLTAD